ncbi:hypothetical protein EVAR_90541_1 [Eumeta japonica]|uniref:Uncharacterized protein n=1 Tax=Eumeta variegata TaxID=151549 RepID=A0A4C1XUX5_EUMVA|nr:hypothetical protein EVAR_90541_1 [Eumeta japonica]
MRVPPARRSRAPHSYASGRRATRGNFNFAKVRYESPMARRSRSAAVVTRVAHAARPRRRAESLIRSRAGGRRIDGGLNWFSSIADAGFGGRRESLSSPPLYSRWIRVDASGRAARGPGRRQSRALRVRRRPPALVRAPVDAPKSFSRESSTQRVRVLVIRQPLPSSIRSPILSQEAFNAPLTNLGYDKSIGDGDDLLSGGWLARLPRDERRETRDTLSSHRPLYRSALSASDDLSQSDNGCRTLIWDIRRPHPA